ncbi:GNAT family N-acetyltransferase [Dokdonia sp. 4H-3-7-5]|uniref:GNAT family N-acetyltransferase n=1 Tax=Dokdonia sp. (strain 4H-3-7-5) TaxID=983548 RepID=UPI00020A6BF1|nr:GNAT family N-acetyltransferase [Dokdonia sp. 4H-3-7-5]AEE20171.1 GCN5-related N-acetyltransferase [Dokdonia sp. 4H-3-7-5]
MIVTPIKNSELDVLQDLAIRTYSAAFAHKNKPEVIASYYEYAFAKAHLNKQLATKDSLWFFARDNDTIIGYLKLNINQAQTEFQEPNGLEIERIYIDTTYLRKGYGKRLIDFSISKARQLKKNYIWLGVWEENPDAITFYKKQGFIITGTHDYDMIAEIQTDYIMTLDI